VVIAVLVGGCAGSAGSASSAAASATSAGAASPSSGSSASPSSAAEAEGAAPPELAGIWRRGYQGELLFLTLDGNGYAVQVPGESGGGRIFVEGDRITFSNSNRCDGTGTYTWSIEDDRLRFSLIGEDPCRARFLLRGSYGRVDP
jgi:hypothetical protein